MILNQLFFFPPKNLKESELPMDESSRMARAKQLGFTIKAYHGTNMKFDEFDVEKGTANPLSGHGPHFTDSKTEAKGYAGRKKTSSVLEVLLRVKKPFNISTGNPTFYSVSDYKKLVGRAPKDSKYDVKGSNIIYDMRKAVIEKYANLPPTYNGHYDSNDEGGPAFKAWKQKYDQAWEAFGGNKAVWIEIYKRLMKLGYDALYDPETGSDHDTKNHTYKKYIIFDAKNVRSINAAFDTAQSDSRNLMA